MRISLLTLLFFGIGLSAWGQNQRPGMNRPYEPDAVEQGNFLINGGAGFLSVFASDRLAGYREEMPPIYLCPEYAFSDGMSAGLFVGYSSFSQTANNIRTTSILAGPRLSYRIFVNEKFDFYTTLFFGVGTLSSKTIDTKQPVPVRNPYFPFYGTMLGGRYYFMPNLALNAEVGFGLTLVNFGLTYRLKGWAGE